jgi:hypothetical protein
LPWTARNARHKPKCRDAAAAAAEQPNYNCVLSAQVDV